LYVGIIMTTKLLLGTAIALVMGAVATPLANAQVTQPGRGEVVIVTGTRVEARSATDTPAPVDVVSGADLVNQGDNDAMNIIRTLVPSFNVGTQPISDAATLVRPVNLRGLPPDSTLVLVNGKRMHRAAVIAFLGGGISDGSQGADISTIPAIALDRIEVLRDGASSQYGSDAIAGVINFILKDNPSGGALEGKWGQTYESDGASYQIAANIGLAVGENGFLNLAGEFQETDATGRSTQRDDAAALIAAGNTAVANPAQIWGQPEVRGDLKLYANFGVDLDANHEFYAFGNYAQRETEGGFYFRNPTNRPGVFAGPLVNPVTGAAMAGGVPSVRVGDLSVNTAGDCPAGIPLTAGGGLRPDPVILAAVTANANCFSFVEMFPGGFTPSFGGELEDMSIAVGLRGQLPWIAGLNYDVSYRYGDNQADFFINNTINASLGPNTPTSFNPGGYGQVENLFNLDFGYGLPVGFASDLNIAFGFEWREEEFEVRAGDAASFALGPLAAPSSAFPLGQGFSSSSNGFPGFTPESAGKSSQSNTSYYIDVETDVTEAVTLQGAVRYEDYDSFGDTTNYKIGGLWRVSDTVRLRSTYSTGFHAPTAGQANVVNVTTQFSNGQLEDEGTFPLSSPAGQIAADYIAASTGSGGLGLARPTLGPEESENFTLGGAFDIGSSTLTVDLFQIDVNDRISRSSTISFPAALQFLAAQNSVPTGGATTTGQLLIVLDNAGVLDIADFAGFEDLVSFAFFSNDFDTQTRGIDVVLTGPLNILPEGNTDYTLALNYTETSVENVGQTISPTRVQQLEEGLPQWKGNFTVSHNQGPWRVLGRLNYYGDYYEAHLEDNTLPIDGDAAVLVDAEVGYKITDNIELIAGVQNLFDQYPVDNPWAGIAGAKYGERSPYGFNGGFYYLKARMTW
jgi:iron complex outermembrane receptor protein